MNPQRPLMLGLVGDSASGKTTLVRGVVRLLGHHGVTPLCLDDYHLFSRAELYDQGLTAADPSANNLEQMLADLRTLQAGGTIRKPVYDHRSGTLRGPEMVAATGLVVAYGMLTLTPVGVTDLFDLTVYLEPDAQLRQVWRLERDVTERGYTAEQVRERQAMRERDGTRFVQIQRAQADLVVRFHAAPADLDIELLLRDAPGAARLAPTLTALAAAQIPGLAVNTTITDEDGRRGAQLLIRADISADAAIVAADLIGNYRPGLNSTSLARLGQIRSRNTLRHSLPLALTQLMIVARLVG
ncbi:MAG: uridine kinase [Oscillochloridaceae bacterium umkhey_bin13]